MPRYPHASLHRWLIAALVAAPATAWCLQVATHDAGDTPSYDAAAAAHPEWAQMPLIRLERVEVVAARPPARVARSAPSQ
jgi:hypothetical protein